MNIPIILLTGRSIKVIKKEIDDIAKYYDKEKDLTIAVHLDANTYTYDSIEYLKKAVENDLEKYIYGKFSPIMKNKMLKTGSNDDLYLIDPSKIEEKGYQRNSGTNKIQPKRKKYKSKKTHRRKSWK